MLGIRYVGPFLDASGYAEAARNYLAALISQGEGEILLSARTVSFEKSPPSAGPLAGLISSCLERRGDYSVNILHMTPENYSRLLEGGKRNIALLTWETERLPGRWLEILNASVDEVWVPSTWNRDCFLMSGLKKPVSVIPHAINPDYLTTTAPPLNLGLPEGTFVFYSIFQWLERKNPQALLLAYLTEFTEDEDVCLVVKTYLQIQDPAQREQERDRVRKMARSLKDSLHLPRPPKMKMILEPLSKEEMLRLHKAGDCFVLPSRAEGFGLCYIEAMALGKPVIGTRYGGNLDFMNDNNSYLIDAEAYPVFGMPWPIYPGTMWWSNPSVGHLRRHMRWVYEQREEAAAKGMQAKKDIRAGYSWEKVGRLMTDLLLERTG